jgi:hypothetical protein
MHHQSEIVQKGTTCRPKLQPTKLPKCGFSQSQAFIITVEEVEETVVGCYSGHRIESIGGSSCSVTGEGQQMPFHNASEMTHLARDHYIPLV